MHRRGQPPVLSKPPLSRLGMGTSTSIAMVMAWSMLGGLGNGAAGMAF